MATLERIAKDFRRLASRFDECRNQDTDRPHYFAEDLASYHVQAGRLLYEAIEEQAFPKKRSEHNREWWDADTRRFPGGSLFESITEATPDQCAMGWVFAVGSWLVAKFPSRFRDNAPEWYWRQQATDDNGKPIDVEGRTLQWVWHNLETGEVLPGSTTIEEIAALDHPEYYARELDGEPASVHDTYDDQDWIKHHRTQAEIDAMACIVLAELLEVTHQQPKQNQASPADGLTDTTRLIVRAVKDLGPGRVKKADVAEKLGYATPDSLDKPMAELVRLGILDSHSGSKGGYLVIE